MNGIFDPQNRFWQFFAKVADVLMLSVAWLFLSLPCVTLGAATSALYDATVKCVLGEQSGTMGRFWSTFRRELKTASLATLAWGLPCAILVWLVWTVRANVVYEGTTVVVLLAAWVAVLLVPVGALCWMFPLLSRFGFNIPGLDGTSLRFPTGVTVSRLISTSLSFAIGFLPRTFLAVAAMLASVALSAWIWVPMLIAPALVAIAWAKIMEGAFQRFMPKAAKENGEEK